MASRFFDEPTAQQKATQQQLARQSNVAASANQNSEALAKTLGQMKQTAPWMKPDAMLSLAQAGITADSKTFEDAARAAGAAKTKTGLGWHSVGDLISGAQRLGYGAFKATARTAWDVLSYPKQAAEGVIRTGHDRWDNGGLKGLLWQPPGGPGLAEVMDQTNLGQRANAATAAVADQQTGISRLTPGNVVASLTAANAATGQGLWTNPATPAGQAQVKAARDAWTLEGGRAFTAGRYAAQQVTEPGTIPYNLLSGLIDASTTVGLDPSNAALSAVSSARNATKVFNSVDVGMDTKAAAGLVDGNRKSVVSDKANQWLASKDGAKVIDFADRSDFPTLYRALGDQVPVEILVKLADAHGDGVMQVLRPTLGITVNNVPTLPTARSRALENVSRALFKKDPKSIRLFQMMPNQSINLDDVDDAVRQVERFAQNGLLPESKRLQRIEEMARATGRNARYNVVNRLMDDVAEHLSSKTVDRYGMVLDVNGNSTRALSTGDEVLVDGVKGTVGALGTGRADVVFKTLDSSGSAIEQTRMVRYDHMRSTDGLLAPSAARKLTRMWSKETEVQRRYFVNASSGQNMPVVGAIVDGNGFTLPTPHLYSEYIGQYAPLPNARDIREATTRWGRFLKGEPITVTANGVTKKIPLSSALGSTLGMGQKFTDTLSSGVWKKMVLLRPAYAVRVVGEEQLRMAGSRMDSLFHHPLSAIAYISGRKGHVGITGDDFADASALADDVDEFAAAQSRRTDHRYGGRTTVSQDTEFRLLDLDNRDEYIDQWADQLLKLRGDEMTRKALGDWANEASEGSDFILRAKEDFWSGNGKALREDMATAPRRDALLTREGSDEYIDSLVARAEQVTGSDPVLTRALLTGKILPAGADESEHAGDAIRDGLKGSRELKAYLRRKADEGAAPSVLYGQRLLTSADRSVREQWDNAVDTLFYGLASYPTNKLSRSPVFKQRYWSKAEELLPFMDEAAQSKTIDSAIKAKLGRIGEDVIGRMRTQTANSIGDLSLEEADAIAKTFALESTKALLYDATRRSQFFDMYRIAMPFGDAWKEVLTSWAKIVSENPKVLNQGRQFIQGARGADPDGNGQGFFYTDPTSKQEMFTVPFSKHLNQVLLNQPIPFSSPVKGLNIFGTVLPGFGPALQVPAGSLLPDIPEADGIRDMIFPAGSPSREGGFVESFIPAWAQKLRQGTGLLGRPDERQWNNTVTNIYSQLLSEGRYDASSYEDMSDAFDEARNKARWLYVLQALAQSTLPSPPTQEFLVSDEAGRLVLMDKLKDDLRSMQEDEAAGGFATANQRFIDKYGTRAVSIIVPRTDSASSLPVTKAARDWRRKHDDIADAFPDVYGFFAPSDGDFDIQAYSDQLRRGERVSLSPEQVAERSNAVIGAALYKQAKSKVGRRNDEVARKWLSDIRLAITSEYPGYNVEPYDLNKTTRTIVQLQQAMENETVASTDAGQGLAIYFEAREKAFKFTGGKSFASSRSTQNVRDWLMAIGDAIAVEHPDFTSVWERALRSEVSKSFDEPVS